MKQDQESNSIEIWKSIPYWPKYEVSNMGRVRRIAGPDARGYINKEKILRPSPKGDAKVTLSDWPRYKSEKVARLVLFAFVGPAPKGTEACHENDDKQDNRLSNLRWDTHRANGKDAIRNGLMQIGESCHKAKLTEDQVREIRRLHNPNVKRGGGKDGPRVGSTRWLAKKYGVHHAQIQGIISGRYWSHVGENNA